MSEPLQVHHQAIRERFDAKSLDAVPLVVAGFTLNQTVNEHTIQGRNIQWLTL